MLDGGNSFGPVAALACALGCGLLMGIERERRKGSGPGRGPAGVRTFSITSLAGATAALLELPPLVVVGAGFVAALGLVSVWRDSSDDPGMTTEMALLMAYLIGVLAAHNQALAAALAVVVTGLLAARTSLHQFSRQWLQPGEVRDGLILAALALLVVPLVPNRPLWGDALNPQVVLRLLVVLLAIQSLAHVGHRLMRARQALGLSALASGFVSSTATIATLGMQSRNGPGQTRMQAGAALLSCVATMAQMLVVAATVQPAWLWRLWAPALGAGVVVLLWGLVLMRPAGRASSLLDDGPDEGAAAPVADTRMFKLGDAAVVALLLTAVQAGVHGLKLLFGDAGVMVGALLAALADLHASVAAVLLQGPPQDDVGGVMVRALTAAVLVHAVSKSVVATASGGWRFAAYTVPGIWGHSLVFVALLWGLGRG